MEAEMDIDTGIIEQDRKGVSEALARLLADTYALYLRTQKYHWNVVGPRFRELHLMFEEQYRELAEATDQIAERIRALGDWAPASFQEFSRLTSLHEQEGVLGDEAMIHNLVDGHRAVLGTARETLDLAEKAGDIGTVDLVTGRVVVHEKTVWMLTATIA